MSEFTSGCTLDSIPISMTIILSWKGWSSCWKSRSSHILRSLYRILIPEMYLLLGVPSAHATVFTLTWLDPQQPPFIPLSHSQSLWFSHIVIHQSLKHVDFCLTRPLGFLFFYLECSFDDWALYFHMSSIQMSPFPNGLFRSHHPKDTAPSTFFCNFIKNVCMWLCVCTIENLVNIHICKRKRPLILPSR